MWTIREKLVRSKLVSPSRNEQQILGIYVEGRTITAGLVETSNNDPQILVFLVATGCVHRSVSSVSS